MLLLFSLEGDRRVLMGTKSTDADQELVIYRPRPILSPSCHGELTPHQASTKRSRVFAVCSLSTLPLTTKWRFLLARRSRSPSRKVDRHQRTSRQRASHEQNITASPAHDVVDPHPPTAVVNSIETSHQRREQRMTPALERATAKRANRRTRKPSVMLQH